MLLFNIDLIIARAQRSTLVVNVKDELMGESVTEGQEIRRIFAPPVQVVTHHLERVGDVHAINCRG